MCIGPPYSASTCQMPIRNGSLPLANVTSHQSMYTPSATSAVTGWYCTEAGVTTTEPFRVAAVMLLNVPCPVVSTLVAVLRMRSEKLPTTRPDTFTKPESGISWMVQIGANCPTYHGVIAINAPFLLFAHHVHRPGRAHHARSHLRCHHARSHLPGHRALVPLPCHRARKR